MQKTKERKEQVDHTTEKPGVQPEKRDAGSMCKLLGQEVGHIVPNSHTFGVWV